jgi:hypothetical protein
MTDNSITTDNSLMTDNFKSLQEKNQQVLDNISNLQQQEKKLYDSLENSNLSSEERQQIIVKINEISQMRLNMYISMKDMHSLYNNNVESSSNALDQSISAIQIIENQLNDTKNKINLLDDQKNNQLRLVEINTYYGKRYNANSVIMKTVILMCIPLIVLAILVNNGMLLPKLYAFFSAIVLIYGCVVLGYQLIDISNRDNMNWDEYNWYFDKTKAPIIDDDINVSPVNPWNPPDVTCVGAVCCYAGTTYDSIKKVCVPNKCN